MTSSESDPPVPQRDSNYAWAAVLLGCFAFVVSLHWIGDFDYWTHLALGREMWQAKAIRIAEPFLLSRPGSPVLTPGWPFEFLLYGLRVVAGDPGVSVMVAAAAAATFAVLWRSVPREGGRATRHLAWAFLALIAFSSRFRFAPRPEIAGYALLAPTLVATWRWHDRPSRGRFLGVAAPLGLWAVVHPSWVIGAVLGGARLALFPRIDFWKSQGGSWRGRLFLLCVSAGAVFSAYRACTFAGGVLGDLRAGGSLSSITEMQPLWDVPDFLWPFALSASIAFLLAWGAREGRVRRLLLWGLAVSIGALVARNVTLGLLGVAPAALEGLRSRSDRVWLPGAGRFPWLPALSAVTLAVIGVQDVDPPWGLGVRWAMFPRDAASFVSSSRLPGPIFNSFDIGGYLDWAWGGAPRTFIDGRVFGADPTFEAVQDVVGGRFPEHVLDGRKIQTIVVRGLYYDSGRIIPFLWWILSRPDWHLVRATDALVFVRGALPEGVGRLSAAEVWRYVLWETDVKASEHGHQPHLWFNRGVARYFLGDLTGAQAAFRQALKEHPEWADYYSVFLWDLGLSSKTPQRWPSSDGVVLHRPPIGSAQ